LAASATGIASGSKRVVPVRPRSYDHLVLARLEAPLGPTAQDVLLNGQIDRLQLDARQAKLDDELVAAAVGVHLERPRATRWTRPARGAGRADERDRRAQA
jgi:hypothetical protein